MIIKYVNKELIINCYLEILKILLRCCNESQLTEKGDVNFFFYFTQIGVS